MTSNLVNIICSATVITCCLAFTRFFRTCCPVCHNTVVVTSFVEKQLSPLGVIPHLHVECANWVSVYAAPNCDMTSSEWFRVRGYAPILADSNADQFTVIKRKKADK